ncbi:hypothetical protein [Methylobacterium sp. R2-1]|uniref:hypothetical protein n=1 Tax=Methylobacterium sp. R2-1 TaxID=2587064 RepID=UPI00160C8E42|nr:hypothetical protein [Methylobacterium sp. R2-1]MBB2964244.1 hypothetical protein [Methylobacterium sp. R2-1]
MAAPLPGAPFQRLDRRPGSHRRGGIDLPDQDDTGRIDRPKQLPEFERRRHPPKARRMGEPGALRGGLQPGISCNRNDVFTLTVPARPTVERQFGEVIEQLIDDVRRCGKSFTRDQKCAAAAIRGLRNKGTNALSAGPHNDHALPRHQAEDALSQIACRDPRSRRNVRIQGRLQTETVLLR